MAMIKRLATLIPIMALTLLTNACSSGRPAADLGSPLSPTTPASSALGPATAPERDAVAAYRGFWDVFVSAAVTSDAEMPELRKYASGQALRLVANSLYMDRKRKQVTKGQVRLDPKVSALDPTGAPTEVTISDCVSDEEWLKYKASGGLVNDVPGGRHATTATVKRTSDGWKVDSLVLQEVGTC
ncbi:hypothetical protein [Actinoplanes sp. NPDC020271]|uniref:hypothetical protein n=1 Tax=Actinoplanes sp. NPDC020271 TaxID=3363896 RepID=UPI0037A38A0B